MQAQQDDNSFLTEINVTPFVDVLLVLLIIFMITAPAMTRSVGVDLPKTRLENESGKEKSSISRTIVVGLDKSNRIIFDRKQYSVKRFHERYSELIKGRTIEKVYIQADSRRYEYGNK